MTDTKTQGAPKITEMRVVPVAGHDSMLLNLSGAHAPFFTRNIVILEDNAGHIGVGEVPGGEKHPADPGGARAAGRRASPSATYNNDPRAAVRTQLRRPRRRRPRPADLRPAHHHPRRHRRRVGAARSARPVSSACRSPRCSATGSSATRCKMLGYLFYVGDRRKTDLPYSSEPRAPDDDWFRLRHEEALTPEAIVAARRGHPGALRLQGLQAQGRRAARRRGDRSGHRARRALPRARITLDPERRLVARTRRSGCARTCTTSWPMPKIRAAPRTATPAARSWPSSASATGLPTATNMIATDWRQLGHALQLQAVDIPLADPHFWTMQGSVRVAQICQRVRADLGIALQQPLRHFARDVHPRRAPPRPASITAIDTHWIWQDGERLTKEPLQDRRRRDRGSREARPGHRDRHRPGRDGAPAVPGHGLGRARRRGRHAVPDPGLEVRQQAPGPGAPEERSERGERT